MSNDMDLLLGVSSGLVLYIHCILRRWLGIFTHFMALER